MEIIEKELNELNKFLIASIPKDKNEIAQDISEYLSAKSKRLRPAFVFLFSKALGIDIDEKIYSLASAVELIHNSTLVHDDIIDNAETRRGKVSLNFKLGNSLSVLAGDILLAVSLRHLVKCGDLDVVKIFSDTLYQMCEGEINQNFAIGKLPSMDEYIKKSENKTAELFKAPLVSLSRIANLNKDDELLSFAYNFGIAFQIKDDLLNILQTDETKPIMSDIHNGIYTAPVIFLNDDIKNVESLSEDEIIQNVISDNKYINKTFDLIKEYADRAIDSISFMEDNQYKQEIIKITQNLYKV